MGKREKLPIKICTTICLGNMTLWLGWFISPFDYLVGFFLIIAKAVYGKVNYQKSFDYLNLAGNKMAEQLLHIVATRMFCKLRPWHDDAYINQRLDIFEAFTLPSVKNQTNQNFHWLLLANPNLSEASKSRIEMLIAGMKNIHIIFVDIKKELHNQKEYEHGFEQFLDNLPGQYDYLLSSRIDSDDCWNIRYVEQVQEKARKLILDKNSHPDFQGILMTFPRGAICYPYEIRGKYGLTNIKISYWSTSVDLLTNFNKRLPLYHFPHSKALKHAKRLGMKTIKVASREPMWLYVQHDLNFALTDTNRWFRWFILVEKLLFRAKPFSVETLKIFALNTNTITDLGPTRKLNSGAETAKQNGSSAA